VSVRSQKYFIKGHPITSRKKAVGFATMSATEHARQRVIVTRTPAPPIPPHGLEQGLLQFHLGDFVFGHATDYRRGVRQKPLRKST
jgi:hypothetical protein